MEMSIDKGQEEVNVGRSDESACTTVKRQISAVCAKKMREKSPLR